MAFKGILGSLALDGLPILTGGQNVPPEGGSLYGLGMAGVLEEWSLYGLGMAGVLEEWSLYGLVMTETLREGIYTALE